MMASLRAGLEVAMRVDRGRPAVRGKLVDVILIVGAAALVLVVVLLNLAQAVLFGWIERSLDRLASTAASSSRGSATASRSLVTPGIVLLLYRFVPARRLKLGDALAGAIVTALLLLAISLVSGMIFDRTQNLSISVIYGSLTSALVFLYSVYLAASALLLGAEIAAAWSRPSEQTERAALRTRSGASRSGSSSTRTRRRVVRRSGPACRPTRRRRPLTRARSAPAAPSRGAPGARSRGRDRSRPAGRGAACARAGAGASPSPSAA